MIFSPCTGTKLLFELGQATSLCPADDGRRRHMRPNPHYRPPHNRRNLPHLRHQLIKLIGIERLDAVGQCLIRLVMDFNDQSIRAHRNRGT